MSDSRQRVALAIDPGSEKCGIAVVDETGKTLLRRVVSAGEALTEVNRLRNEYSVTVLVLGGGTGSRLLRKQLAPSETGLPLHIEDETNTTLEAQERYMNANPPQGWQRLLPRSLRMPEAPVDDYVAVILGERFWKRDAEKTS